MSQTPQTMLHSLLQDKTPKVMHRNSDDFYPDITDSNPWHVFVNAHNALLDRHLNVIPDWDMFQTGDPSLPQCAPPLLLRLSSPPCFQPPNPRSPGRTPTRNL